jgi:hypothetical protein
LGNGGYGYDRLNSVQTASSFQDKEFSKLSDLVTALIKIPWIDAKSKDFEEAALQYEETYKDEIRKNPGPGALNSQAAKRIIKIAKEVLNQDVDLYKHPNFDINHNCCFSLEETRWTEHAFTETANMIADEHNTAKQTIQDIRRGIEAERAKYQTVISLAAQK